MPLFICTKCHLFTDLLSLFGQPNDIPKSPNNFSVSVNYIEVCSGSRPTLKFSWKMPTDEGRRLTAMSIAERHGCLHYGFTCTVLTLSKSAFANSSDEGHEC